MPPSSSRILFASSNRHKFQEASRILDPLGIKTSHLRCSPEEIQSDSVARISRHKARHAFGLCKKPVIVEDDGLTIDSLGGFPGPYSSYVFDTVGNRGILDLVNRHRRLRKTASFVSVVTYCDRAHLESFSARVRGRISPSARGTGWGYDPIFIPRGTSKTFAQLDAANDKDRASHRRAALVKFSRWFLAGM